MFPCPTSPLARQSGLWQNWLCGFIAGLLSTRSCTHRQITAGRVPEGPAFFQAIRRLATVNWGGTVCTVSLTSPSVGEALPGTIPPAQRSPRAVVLKSHLYNQHLIFAKLLSFRDKRVKEKVA